MGRGVARRVCESRVSETWRRSAMAREFSLFAGPEFRSEHPNTQRAGRCRHSREHRDFGGAHLASGEAERMVAAGLWNSGTTASVGAPHCHVSNTEARPVNDSGAASLASTHGYRERIPNLRNLRLVPGPPVLQPGQSAWLEAGRSLSAVGEREAGKHGVDSRIVADCLYQVLTGT